jgi:hypothetical protein
MQAIGSTDPIRRTKCEGEPPWPLTLSDERCTAALVLWLWLTAGAWAGGKDSIGADIVCEGCEESGGALSYVIDHSRRV